ncbi:MAG: recombinase family protein [Candidatus Omnitrophica bacterium]|nr:recombinase family protein [Candidatus Omnitrophota bacterium]
MNNIIGYARVSKKEQSLNLQRDALEKAGCNKIFTDKISGATEKRPGLDACFSTLKPGDLLVVWRLDRIGRSLKHLVLLMEELKEKNILFKSTCEAIDTTTTTGMLIFNMFALIAEFERGLIRERTQAGLNAARARGRTGGRIPVKSTDPKVLTAKKMHKNHGMSIKEICKTLNLSRASVYRYVAL